MRTALAACGAAITLLLGACATGPSLRANRATDPATELASRLSVRPDSYESYRWAIETDNLVSFQQLVAKGLGPNLVMPDTNPALLYAMQTGASNVATWLLTHPQLDIHQTNGRGDTALMTASALGELGWVETAIKRGGQVNPPSGWTPLHYAAAGNKLSVVEYLLKKSARIDAPSANGTTPLMMAARSNALEVVSLLVKKGAQTELANEAGFSALSYAKRNGNAEMEALLRKSSANCSARC